jgi:hypothetical protein
MSLTKNGFWDEICAMPEPPSVNDPNEDKEYERRNCAYCFQNQNDSMMPRHFASDGCESGGRNHCTCEVCY